MKARSERIVVEDLGAECVVYDMDTKRAHSMNSSLRWIWQQCDGVRTEEDIVRQFAAKFQTTNAEEDVRAGIQQLAAASLLSGNVPAAPVQQPGLSRRHAVGAVSLAVPVLTSILVPTPAAAKSKPKANNNTPNGNNGNGPKNKG